ncbi:hypothetical protein EMIHUDRAFT_234587 [Emiliania huxleyi CCMP1516]|uniref:Uncharacterized protein n=2 Tax=Emiliania huxleyi TaxID=2903 RepID=A0A0D3JZ27_EMIH1|nr:hypothetical protein EMIHUDRAFT_234587 [Emiliania huxleyi CCMP1516]EOD28762.1 hypothetical protein EMIHUDRAFT_234587 [Emiliania huxleyi CCMP1516]|eukprot:XP_005781191.1 hypothetical protein EMIHUDRAFT_234587 [Emiliania huxleyi CCMP1516]
MRLAHLRKAPEERRLAEVATCYELLSQIYLMNHRIRLADYCARRSLALGLRLASLAPVVARAYADLLAVTAATGGSRRAVAYYKAQALGSCRQLGEYAQLAFTLLAVGIHDAASARWAAARDNLSRAREIVHGLKDRRLWEDVVSHRGHLEFYAGDFAASLECYQAALESAEARADKQMINRCQSGIAAVNLASNRTAEAHAILKETNSYGQLALCLLRMGDEEGALGYALKVKDRFKGPRTKYYVLKAFASTAEAVSIASRLGMAYERALGLERCAQFLRDLGINPGAEAGGRSRSLGSGAVGGRAGAGDFDAVGLDTHADAALGEASSPVMRSGGMRHTSACVCCSQASWLVSLLLMFMRCIHSHHRSTID